MPLDLKDLASDFSSERTVLVLGSGASLPSGAPSVGTLIKIISDKFNIDASGLTLKEIASLAETRRNRSELISALRTAFTNLRAKGAILNIPHHAWKSIFTTNYDELLENAYERAHQPLSVYSSNFDFSADSVLGATKLYKIHGTIRQDIVDGHQARIIISDSDYDAANDYRETIYDRLRADMAPNSDVLVIGSSLSDPDLYDVIQRAISINKKAKQENRISVLVFESDERRAQLLEARGLRVCFGSLDDFIKAVERKSVSERIIWDDKSNPLDVIVALRPVTLVASEESNPAEANASAIFNGWPANFPEIAKGLTFDRTICDDLVRHLQLDENLCTVLLGASGVGKTTAARQTLLRLSSLGFYGYEHKGDHQLSPSHWSQLAARLKSSGLHGILLVDDAHSHLYALNELIDNLASTRNFSLRLILTSSRNHWGPRVKTPNLYRYGKEFSLSKLDLKEVDRLLVLVEKIPELRALVETGFSGFSYHEKRRRLADRCESDMFVCLKNIFASEKFDDIVLREYASLATEVQEIYKLVAAMEFSGVHAHRQLVMRTLGLAAGTIPPVLASLDEIVHEYTVSSRDGVYGWKVRHYVIAGIITKYKFYDYDQRAKLFETIIDNISPTYEIEIRTIREICSNDNGIPALPDKHKQNVLYRRMMSVAPGERIPRHRLIRNLIALNEFEKAESEIRIFEKDFRKEAPIARYRILLTLARAITTPGLMHEDRMAILEDARALALSAIDRYDSNKYVLSAYCEVGVETFKLTGAHSVFDDAMSALKRAESRLGDPDVTKLIVKYQRRISGQSLTDSVGEPKNF